MKTEILVGLPGGDLYREECRLQTLTYGDATAINLISKSKDVQKLFEVLNNRASLNVYDLTLPDFKFLLFWQRINSYSTFPMNIHWKCSQKGCEQKNNDELTGPKLVITDIDPDYDHGMTLDFPDSGPLRLRLKLVKDEIASKQYLIKNRIQDKDGELLEEVLTACMLELNGGTLEERILQVREMSADDQFLLKSFESEFDYGVQNYAEFTCEKCKEVAKIGYEFDLANFFPSIQDRTNVRSRIIPSSSAPTADSLPPRDRLCEAHPHQEHSHDAPQEAQGTQGPSTSPAQEQKKEEITMSPEDLSKLIADAVQSATSPLEEEIGNIDQIVQDR